MPRRRQCATMVLHEYLAETQAGYRRNIERVERAIERSVRSGAATRAVARLFTIPVVVHVVYNREPRTSPIRRFGASSTS